MKKRFTGSELPPSIAQVMIKFAKDKRHRVSERSFVAIWLNKMIDADRRSINYVSGLRKFFRRTFRDQGGVG